MIKIIKATEHLPVSSIITLIYGAPGAYKTSLAFTARNVLLIDTDNGAKRSAFRKDTVLVSSWDDIASLNSSDIEKYDTIAIDTVGRALDFLATQLIEKNPKLGYNGALAMQGWGQLKSIFTTWTKNIINSGKDIVLIAHEKEEKSGDDVFVKPDIQGGTYGEIFKISDIVGYLHHDMKGALLSFTPTDTRKGKNQGFKDDIRIPDFNQEPFFLAEIIDTVKERINSLSEQQKEVVDRVDKLRKKIEKVKTLPEFKKLFSEISKEEDGAPKMQAKGLLLKQAKAIGIRWDKEGGDWVEAEKPKEAVEQKPDDLLLEKLYAAKTQKELDAAIEEVINVVGQKQFDDVYMDVAVSKQDEIK